MPSDSAAATNTAHRGLDNDLWEAVFARAPLGMVLFDRERRIVRANVALTDMLGTTADAIAGRRLYDITHPEDRARADEAIDRVLTRDLTWVAMQQRCLRDDGDSRWSEVALRIFWDAAGDFLLGLGIVRDISDTVRAEAAPRQSELRNERDRVELRESVAELERAQARLQIADRMAAMGTLAAGVAHEINNPLGLVMANLGFAQEEVLALQSPPAGPLELDKRLTALAWALGEAQEGAARVRNIVLDLKTFSHPDADVRVAVNVRRVIDSALNIAHAEIRGRAQIVRRFQPVPAVLGNEARLSQLFLNLIINAAHSILSAISGGRPTAEGGAASDAAHEIRLTVEPLADGRVMTEISDTGVGIGAEHLERIFDPFFTTKPIGLGTGLGLSICHGIVHSLGGEISVRSTPGAGSSFRVVLPAAPGDEVESTPPAPVTNGARHVQRARILVVDDEPMMGSAMRRVLAEHEVLALTSAREALARIVAGEHFDVILCDVMMPDLSGIELHEAIAAEAPDLLPRLVFVTGGAYTPEAIDFLDRVTNLRLEKPILPSDLQDAVARVLHGLGPLP